MVQSSWLLLVPWYAVHLFFFLMPGLLLAVVAVRHWQLEVSFTVLLAVVISSVAGYIAFWIYFWNPDVGCWFSAAAMLAGVVGLGATYCKRQSWRCWFGSADVLVPVAWMFTVGLFYLCLLYAVDLGADPEDQPQDRFMNDMFAPDNIIPLRFAERLFRGEDPRPIIGDWHSSDRPPLQAGLVLLQRPLIALSNLPVGLHYQLLGVAIQCSWVPAVWFLCRRAGLPFRRVAQVMILLIPSGFFLIHTVFTWPKMISGALGIPACGLMLKPDTTSRPSLAEIGIAATGAALALLAHGGIAFTLLPLGLLLLRPRFFPGVGRVLFGGSVFVAVLAPWLAYQRYYDPPGNRLVKWHLGGVIPIDERTSWKTIVNSYTTTDWREIASNKWVNIQTVLGRPLEVHLDDWATMLDQWRHEEYQHVARALGILNLGWLLLLPRFGRRWLVADGLDLRVARRMLGLGLAGLLTWVLLMFLPNTALIHQGSYATMLLLFTALAALLSSLPARLFLPICAWQVLGFCLTWLASVPANVAGDPNLVVCALGVVALVVLCQALCLVRKWPDSFSVDSSKAATHTQVSPCSR